MKPSDKINKDIEYLEQEILDIKLVKFRLELRKTQRASKIAILVSILCVVINVALLVVDAIK